MNQRRSYPNSGDFNLDDLFRPEPGQQGAQQTGPQQPDVQQQGQQPGQPEYLGDGGHGQAPPAQGAPWTAQQQYAPPQQPAGPAEAAPATQYLPPYPTGDPQAGGYPAQGAPQGFQGAPQGGYAPADHQGYAPTGVTYPQQGGGYPQAEPAYPATAHTPARGVAAGGGRRPSGKLIIGGVLAGCAAAGILVAILVSGGDPDTGKGTGQAAPATASTKAGKSGTPAPDAMSAAAKEQAKALSDLIGTANDSRQAVIGAVAAVQKCDKLPESQQALTDAAGKRQDLKTKLAALKTDKLSTGGQLVEQLNRAWDASATADTEYAAWAGDAQAGCDPKKQDKDNQHYKAAVAASGSATTAKKQAAGLWNAIAGQAGLPTRSDGDL